MCIISSKLAVWLLDTSPSPPRPAPSPRFSPAPFVMGLLPEHKQKLSVISEEAVGNSWDILYAILGLKYQQNHPDGVIRSEQTQTLHQKVFLSSLFVLFVSCGVCMFLSDVLSRCSFWVTVHAPWVMMSAKRVYRWVLNSSVYRLWSKSLPPPPHDWHTVEVFPAFTLLASAWLLRVPWAVSECHEMHPMTRTPWAVQVSVTSHLSSGSPANWSALYLYSRRPNYTALLFILLNASKNR